jgi:SAM-dependent methyltransferase
VSISYHHTEDVYNMDAPREVVPIIMELIKPKSVLDVGCGTGTWLKAFEEAGVEHYYGLDGHYVKESQLQIPYKKFIVTDFSKQWAINEEFDLVVSLEVAEHLPESSADTFIESLVAHGDVILFSAAVPGQGGQHHINEQWPEYWQQKFAKHGFYFHDTIRPLIWNNEKVNWWYRQNIFIINRIRDNAAQALSKVHPELFKIRMGNGSVYEISLLKGIQLSAAILFNALKLKLKNLC